MMQLTISVYKSDVACFYQAVEAMAKNAVQYEILGLNTYNQMLTILVTSSEIENIFELGRYYGIALRDSNEWGLF